MPKIKLRKVENGLIVSCGKKEYFCNDDDDAREKITGIFLTEIAPVLAQKESDKLFSRVAQ